MSAEIYLDSGINEVAQQNESVVRSRMRTALMVGAASVAAFVGGHLYNADTARAQDPNCTTEQTADGSVQTCILPNGSVEVTTITTTETSPAEEAEPVPVQEESKKRRRSSRPVGGIAVYKSFDISSSGKLPFNYDQDKGSWADNYWPGGGKTYASSACGITSYAMVRSAFKGRRIDPAETGRDNKWAVKVGGSDHKVALIGGRRDGFNTRRYGNDSHQITGNQMQKVRKELKDGALAVALARPGTFTGRGHYITLSYNHKNNSIRVTDPNSKNNGLENNRFTTRQLLGRGNIDQVTVVKANHR